jgi:hypothetical protein
MVDGLDGRIVGPVYTSTLRTSEEEIAIGFDAGKTSQGNVAIAIGAEAGKTSQGTQAVAIGNGSGFTGQGAGTTAIGSGAGRTNQGAGAVAIGGGAADTGQGANAVAVGAASGQGNQGIKAVAVGYTAGQTNQGADAVAIGNTAGTSGQGAYSIAIGTNAGQISQHANSIILNATGSVLNSGGTSRLYVDPIRNTTGANGVVQYDSTTKEVTYSSTISGTSFTGNIFTSLIDSADSSAITVTPKTIFSSDVTVENELTVTNNIITGRLKTTEIEGITDELNIYSNWAKDTGVSIVSQSGVESVTLTSNKVVAVVTGIGATQHNWVFDDNGQIQFPDTRFQTGAAISIAELKVLVAACVDFAAFKTAIAALI